MATKSFRVVEPKGKLGFARWAWWVSTTFIAVWKPLRKGFYPSGVSRSWAPPAGKRTRIACPLIKDFVPLAKIEDLCFWSLGHL